MSSYGTDPSNRPGEPHQPYGGMPTPPPDVATGQSRSAEPKEVKQAATALYVIAAVQVISLLLTLTQLDTIEDEIRAVEPGVTESDVQVGVTIGIGIAVLLTLVFVGLPILAAVKARQGRNWARILGTVMAAIAGLLALLGLGSGGPTAILNIVTVLAAIAAIVLLWRKPSSEYFAAAGPRG